MDELSFLSSYGPRIRDFPLTELIDDLLFLQLSRRQPKRWTSYGT